MSPAWAVLRQPWTPGSTSSAPSLLLCVVSSECTARPSPKNIILERVHCTQCALCDGPQNCRLPGIKAKLRLLRGGR